MNFFLYFQSAFQINLVFFSFGLLLLSLLLFYFEHQRHFSNSFQHSSHLSVGMSSLCQFGSLQMGMFNLLTNSKLNESFNPLHHLSLTQQPGDIGKFKYLLIFHHFFYHVLDIFRLGKPKKKSLVFVFQQTEISQLSRIPRYPVEENQISFFRVFLVVFAIQ